MANEPALYARMEMRVAQAEKQMAKFAQKLDGEMGGMERRTNKAAKNMESSLNKGFSKMHSIVSEFSKGLFAGIAAGGVAGIAASVAKVAQSFADLGREAKTAGLNVEDFQRWRYVADQNRIGVDALIDGFKELSLRADEYIQTGKGSAAESFQRLGMSPADVKDRIKDPSAFMLELIDRTKRLKDTAAGVRIFDELLGGQGGEQFVRLIEQGRQGITSTLIEADKMGAVMDENFIKRAEEVDKKFNQIASTIGSTLKSAIVDAVGALSAFISSWNELNEKSLSGIRAELDILQKQKERWESQPAGDWQDSVAGVFGKDRDSQLAAINAEMKKYNDELERRKNLTTPVVNDLPPVKPYIPPKTNTGGSGKSPADRERDKAAKAAERERKAVNDLIKDLQFEASLVGKSALEKEKLTALRHAGAAATAAEKAQIEQLVEANFKASEAFDRQRSAIQDVNDAGREFAGTLVDGLLNGAKASDLLADAFGRLADRFLNSGLDALFNSVTGGGKTSFLSGIIPGFASGTNFAPGGVALVGEKGPELVNLPRGSQVIPNHKLTAPTMPRLSSTTTNNSTTNNAPTINVSVSGGGLSKDEVRGMVQEGVGQGILSWQKSTGFAVAVSGGVKQGKKRGFLR